MKWILCGSLILQSEKIERIRIEREKDEKFYIVLSDNNNDEWFTGPYDKIEYAKEELINTHQQLNCDNSLKFILNKIDGTTKESINE